MSITTASAPGKVMLMGEYAVLHGGPAIVAAIDKRLILDTRQPQPEEQHSLPPEIQATLAHARARFGVVIDKLHYDATAFYHGSHKLGLGSSAAACAATAALALDLARQPLQTPHHRQLLFELALAGHRTVAPLGSGADVAASAYGGLVLYQQRGSAVTPLPVGLFSAFSVSLVFTGRSARTSNFLSALHILKQEDPEAHHRLLVNLVAKATEFADALLNEKWAAVLEHVRAYATLLEELGVVIAMPVVDENHAQIAQVAALHGGAAKPSGAGGGDIAVAFLANDHKKTEFEADCRHLGYMPIEFALAPEGARVERR